MPWFKDDTIDSAVYGTPQKAVSRLPEPVRMAQEARKSSPATKKAPAPLPVATSMPENVKDVVCAVVDQGQSVSLALKLAETYKKVYYINAGQTAAFPVINTGAIGEGFDSIELVDNIFDIIPQTHLFVFPDVYLGSWQVYLEGLGKAVWGSRHAEELETDRVKLMEALKSVGLPVPDYTIIRGMEALRAYLKTAGECFVKISHYRGMFESFHVTSYKLIQAFLDKIAVDLGGRQGITDFIVFKPIKDAYEGGIDTYCINGEWPEEAITGVEIKDAGYLCWMMRRDKMPEQLTRPSTKLGPLLKKLGQRGFYSDENRIDRQKVPSIIDLTQRLPSPPGEIELEMITNLAEVIYFGARGKMVQPKHKYKFAVQIVMHSTFAEKCWQALYADPKYEKYIKLHCCCKIDGILYFIPQQVGFCEIGGVIGFGNTIEEAIDMVKDVADHIEGDFIDIPEDVLDKAMKEIEKAKSFGLKMEV